MEVDSKDTSSKSGSSSSDDSEREQLPEKQEANSSQKFRKIGTLRGQVPIEVELATDWQKLQELKDQDLERANEMIEKDHPLRNVPLHEVLPLCFCCKKMAARAQDQGDFEVHWGLFQTEEMVKEAEERESEKQRRENQYLFDNYQKIASSFDQNNDEDGSYDLLCDEFDKVY